LRDAIKVVPDHQCLSAHANPLHPDPAIGESHRTTSPMPFSWPKRWKLTRWWTFSGCPGGGPEDNIRTGDVPWPPDFSQTVKWQWEAVMIPYWQKTAQFAKEHGVKLAIEMHPGFCVYSVETALALREATADNVGTNFDPSHLFWQGADPVHAIRALGKSIYHFHAKDTVIDRSMPP